MGRATEIRKTILKIANQAGSPHIGSALSCVDILSTLYGKVMYIPIPFDEEKHRARDIFILSKAHSAMALYATLYQYGAMSLEETEGYYQNNGTLPAHTDRTKSSYIEISAGSLGHGLPIAVGMALAIKKHNENRRVFVLLGDGECQEGSVWESAMLAPKLGLNNLIVLVDKNNLQGYGRATELVDFEGFSQKWRAFGWECVESDGHSEEEIFQSIDNHQKSHSRKPLCVVCHTIKGKGVSFMEDKLEWHYYLVTDEIYQRALKELK